MYCTLYTCTAHYTQVLHTIHGYCTLYTGTTHYTCVQHTIHRYCTLYTCTAHYTHVLHTLHMYCTLYTGTVHYIQVLHTIHRYCTLYTGTAHYTPLLHTKNMLPKSLYTVQCMLKTVSCTFPCRHYFADHVCLRSLRQVVGDHLKRHTPHTLEEELFHRL